MLAAMTAMRSLAAAALAALSLAAHAGPRLIVAFEAGDVEGAFSPGTRVAKLARDTGVDARHVRRLALGAQLVELPDGADARAAARALKARGGVAIAIPDRHVQRAKVPNDTLAEYQWYLTNDAPSTNAYAAWDITTGSPAVVVAMVDTGILAHPDLAGRVLPGYDFISDAVIANDGDGRDADPTDPGDWVSSSDLASALFEGCAVGDSSWHGTNTAGLVAANGNNAFALAGMDWGVRILPLRALGKCGGFFSDIFDAIAWAAGMPVPGTPPNPYPAHVVNMSLGAYGEPCTADEDALLASMLTPTGLRAIVAAAGNNAADANGNFPSSCPSTIAVTATSNTGDRTFYSNYGTSVDIAAPGGDRGGLNGLIYVLSNFGTTTAGAYAIAAGGGTSYAAPMVSGVISLMLAVAPDLTPAQVRTILTTKYKPFPPESRCTQTTCGKGIVDARAAVIAAQATLPPAAKVPVVEYFHAGFGHYFMTADPDEIAGLDGGAFGGAFARTGRQFNAWNGPAPGTLPVCRFFTAPGRFGAKSSHFYTADPVECAGVKTSADWQYERIAFHIAVPIVQCPVGLLPVFRMYNDGMGGAPNHAFTTSGAHYHDLTTTQGWLPEGIKLCAPP
jgi:serine protease